MQLSKGPCHTGPAAGGLLRRLALYLFSQTVFSMLQGYGFHELPAQVPARSTLPLLSSVQAMSAESCAVACCSTICTVNRACCMCVIHIC